jgi:hypothetical protein
VLAHFVDRAGGEVAEGEGAVGGADQAGDAQAQMFEDAADFAVLAFGQRQLDPGIGAGAAFQIGVDRAVTDAVDLDAFDQFFELRLGDVAIGSRPIGAGDAGAGQFERTLQLAVGGQQEQPFGVEIEPPDRHHPGQPIGQAVVDGRAAFRVALRGQQPRRLVVTEQPRRGGRIHRFAVDSDAAERLDQRRRSRDNGAVDGDSPLRDHPLDLTPRRDAGARQQFGDPLAFP